MDIWRRNPRARKTALLLILLVNLAFDVVGLDWGLPYLWHSDEKIGPANGMIMGRTLHPHYFINPSLHIYATAAALELAYALYPDDPGPKALPPNMDPAKAGAIADAYRRHLGRDIRSNEYLNWYGNPNFEAEIAASPEAQAFRRNGSASPVPFGYGYQWQLPRLIQMTDPNDARRPVHWAAHRLTRGLSVIFALATLLVMYRIGRDSFGEGTGLLAAAMLAVTMGFVNQAHFATVEGLLFLLTMLSLEMSGRVATRGLTKDYVWSGVMIGLACSTKYTAGLLVVPMVVGHLFRLGWRGALKPSAFKGPIVAAAVTILAFVATTPYAVLDWRTFMNEGVIFSWTTGAPTGTLIGTNRTWDTYAALLSNIEGWPLFLLSVFGLGWAVSRVASRLDAPVPRSTLLIQGVWAILFYAFLGASSHHAFRFIMPIVPSLILFAAWAGARLMREASGQTMRRAAVAAVVVVMAYSTVYTAYSDYMMLHDTRYEAGAWLHEHQLGTDDTIDYLGIDPYIPFFDRPVYHVAPPVLFVYDPRLHNDEFWKAANAYLEASTHPIVDSDFFWDRYLDYPEVYPERVEFYRRMFVGDRTFGYAPIKTFSVRNPWWMDPRPERISPNIVIFAKPGMVTERQQIAREFQR